MVNKDHQPKNWPPHLSYLKAPRYSKNLTAEQLRVLRREPQPCMPIRQGIVGTLNPDVYVIPPSSSRGSCPIAKIITISDPTHPANGQSGLFATRDLRPGQLVLQYLGELHSSLSYEDTTLHRGSDYDLWVDKEAGIAVDAARAGSEARFVNDYRGVADGPNAEFREVWDAARRERGIAVFVLPQGKKQTGKAEAKRKGKATATGGRTNSSDHGMSARATSGVKKGSEILVSYGKGFWGGRHLDCQDEYADSSECANMNVSTPDVGSRPPSLLA